MSERRNTILVGAFVVGVVLIAIVTTLLFAAGRVGASRIPIVMVFDGSLRGLTVGAPIALRGLTIGQVTDIDLILDTADANLSMEVVGEIDPSTVRFDRKVGEQVGDQISDELVRRGLRAQLNTQSLLTGLLYVQLDFHPDTEPRLVATVAPYPQIPTIPTELEQLRRSLAEIDYHAIVENVDRIAASLESFLSNDDMQALPGTLRATLVSLENASRGLNETLAQGSPALVALLDEGSRAMNTLNEGLPAIEARLGGTLDRMDAALDNAVTTLERLENASAPDSGPRRQIAAAVQELSLAARALRSLARSLEEHPEALLRGRREEGP
jgi:paraquat-inducible protein B